MGTMDKKEFVLKGTQLRSSTEAVLKQFSTVVSDNGFTKMIYANNFDSKDHSCLINYFECSDSGNFINFGGLMVNTETLYAALGYAANNALYIPVIDMVEFFNIVIYEQNPPVETILNKEDILYLIEGFKLEGKNFDAHGFCKEKLDGTNSSSTYKYKSVIMNYIDGSVINNSAVSNNSKYKNFYLMDSNDMWESMTFVLKRVVKGVDSLGKELFGNFIVEEDIEASMDLFASNNATLKVKPVHYDPKYQAAYLKNIKDRGIDPDFARELSSVGLGINRRAEVLEGSSMGSRDLSILSSGAYITAFGGETVKTLTDEKIATYNLMDLLRGVGRDQDLYFSLDMAKELGSDKIYETLIKKLDIESDISRLGDKFMTNLNSYTTKMLNLIDRGSLYSSKVTIPQGNMVPFSSREMINGGKLFSKLAERLLGRFK